MIGSIQFQNCMEVCTPRKALSAYCAMPIKPTIPATMAMQKRAVSNRCLVVSTVVIAVYSRNITTHMAKVDRLLSGLAEKRMLSAI